jgi:hypothetical protein
MEQSPVSATKIAIKWSLIYLLTAIAITFAFEAAKFDLNSPVKYLGYIPLILFLFLAQKEYKDKQGGYIKFGDAFLTGFWYGLFAGILFAVFTFVYLSFISPELFANSIEAQRDAMAAKGLSPDQVDKGIEIAKKYGAIIGSVGIAIGYIILGLIVSLIGAAIFKKERTAFDQEPTSTDSAV